LATFLVDNHKNRNLFEYFLQLFTRKEPVNYYEYIKSPEWKLKSQQAKSAAGHQCQRCGSSRRLECHHKTYERLGHEREGDLEVLCHKCHERISK
jgi:hypothetical protein